MEQKMDFKRFVRELEALFVFESPRRGFSVGDRHQYYVEYKELLAEYDPDMTVPEWASLHFKDWCLDTHHAVLRENFQESINRVVTDPYLNY